MERIQLEPPPEFVERAVANVTEALTAAGADTAMIATALNPTRAVVALW